MRVWKLGILLVPLLLAPVAQAPASTTDGRDGGTQRFGALEFPKDEHQHLTGWDYWWGAVHLVTESGNRYTVGIGFNSHWGVGVTGHHVFPHQGPYDGQAVMTLDGPPEWGHPEGYPDRFVRKISTYVPGVSDLLRYETLDAGNGLKDIGRWERTSLDDLTYRLRIDNDDAKVHPDGDRVKLVVDLHADMYDTPLLAGGTGQWWYGIPETYGYPSRSFQYMQAAETLTGTLELEQPDGTVLHETVVPGASQLLIVHEYDASPEDLFAGLALAQATQVHPRYPQYYSGGMPWELLFLDLGNGAQLMVAALAFHDTPDGTVAPVVGPDQPTYRAMATLRLPTGESVPLDDVVRVEHLSYRRTVGHVPTFLVQVQGVWVQSWEFRVSYPGGEVEVPGGGTVAVPPFDLGVAPQIDQAEPAPDDEGNRQAQRVPFDVRGAYGGCPVAGFGWSELIINWYGREDRDPWWTGGSLPPVPAACDADGGATGGTGSTGAVGDLNPPAHEPGPPPAPSEGCGAYEGQERCEYVAPGAAGVSGYGSEPGGWTVTITRPGEAAPIVVRSAGGSEMYACGTVRAGDHVVVEARPGSSAFVGNPGICF